jgi:HK97 family phage major capsid protein
MARTIELRQKRAALIAEARTILDKAEGENRSLTTGDNSEQARYDALLTQTEEMKARIEREERQAHIEAENAQHVGGAVPSTVEVTGQDKKREKGQGFLDAVRAIGVGGRDRRVAAQFAEETLHNPELARALSSSVATGGGFAVPTTLAQEFIEFLRPASVVRAAGARVLPMPNGNMSLPRITGGASASWIGENTNIGATQQTLGQVKLTAKKLAALVPISNDLIRYANPQTDAVIRQDLVLAVAQAEDLAFLRGDGTAYTPKGIKNWIQSSNQFSANVTVDIAHITTDLGAAISNLLTNNVKLTMDSGAWFFSPRTFIFLKTLRNTTTGQYAFPELQAANPTLLGYRVAFTSQIPINLSGTNSEFYFVNMSDCIIGEGANLILDVSSEAAYVDGSGNTISAFAQDQTVIRVIEENDFAMRYDVSGSVVTTVTY